MKWLQMRAALVAALLAAALSVPASAQQVGLAPGMSTGHAISAASLNPTSVVAGRTILAGLHAINTNAATAYLKLYDLAVAPTCGTSTVKMTYPMLQNVPVSDDALRILGVMFANGLAFCITGALADADTTNATTGIVVDFFYEQGR